MNTVVLFAETLPRIAERIRAAYDRTQHGRQEWIEGTLELAVALADGRERFPADRQFSIWLAENDLDVISHDSRAALLNMAVVPNILRDVLTEQEAELEPITVWRKTQHRFRQPSKPEIHTEIIQSAPITVPVEPEQPVLSDADAKSEVRVEVIKRNHPFYGLERANEIAAIYRHNKTRAAIGFHAKKHRAIWPMILKMVDAGILTPTDGIRDQPNLGILFPDAPLTFRQSFDLSKPKELLAVKEQVIPAVMENRQAIIAAPDKIDEIIKSHMRQLYEAADAERRAKKVEAAKANLNPTETEVIMFGRRFWPIIDLPHPDLSYSFEELRHAAWTFRELHKVSRLSSDSAPQSCGIRIRHIIKFLNGYLNSKVMYLLNDMSRALQENAEGEEKLPDMPNLDRPYD